MRVKIVLAAMLLAAFARQAEADSKRQLEAHEHGRGKLNIAIEEKSLFVELEVPGADIVGFEHAAMTASDKAAVDAAKHTFAAATSVLSLPDAAGCTLTETKVSFSGDQEPDEKDQGSHGLVSEGARPDESGDHAEFHVEYAFSCTDVGALIAIGFPYFDQFPGARELEVTMITDKGQKQFEVNRRLKRINLRGLI